MSNLLLLYTEPPTRRVFEHFRPGRLVFAGDEVTDEDRRVYDECIQLPPVTEVHATVRILERLRADRVVVQTEYGLLPGALLANGRTPSLRAALLCTNKWLCRQVLRDARVPVPRFALVEEARQVRRFAERYPVVIKPVASTLGRGVMRIDRENQVEERVERMRSTLPKAPDVLRCREFAHLAGLSMECDPARQFLVEEFVDGTPYETDGLIFDDRVRCFGVVEQACSSSPGFYIEGYLYPADRPAADLQSVTRAALGAVGLTNAGFSIEFRDGVVIEINGRLGEDDGLPDLFRAALGVTPIEQWLDESTQATPQIGHHALAYANCYRGGRVVSISPSGEPNVLVRAGAVLVGPEHPGFSPHVAYAQASHPSSSAAAYRSARARVDTLEFNVV